MVTYYQLPRNGNEIAYSSTDKLRKLTHSIHENQNSLNHLNAELLRHQEMIDHLKSEGVPDFKERMESVESKMNEVETKMKAELYPGITDNYNILKTEHSRLEEEFIIYCRSSDRLDLYNDSILTVENLNRDIEHLKNIIAQERLEQLQYHRIGQDVVNDLNEQIQQKYSDGYILKNCTPIITGSPVMDGGASFTDGLMLFWEKTN